MEQPASRKKRFLLFYIAIGLIVVGLVLYFQSYRFFPKLDVAAYAKNSDKPAALAKVYHARLSGISVSKEVFERRPVGSMVENSQDSRPQSGLDKADIIMEALAEGGITRFYSIWQSRDVDEIGPIRSARPYYVSWAAGFRAAYTHIGQSPEALSKLKALGDAVVPDINFGFRFSGGYQRVPWRFAPHNVYSSTKKIRQLVKGLGQDKAGTYPGYLFKDDLAFELRPAVGKVPRVDFSGFGGDPFTASYKYDRKNNLYVRSTGGGAAKDKVTKKTLTAKNVIIMYLPTPSLYPSGHGRINVKNVGSGKAHLFRDGGVSSITWTKKDDKSPLVFKDAAGYEVILNRGGTTWITSAFPYSKVKY